MAILAAPFVAIGIGLYANYAAGPGLPPDLVARVRALLSHPAAPRPHAITLPVRAPVVTSPVSTAASPLGQGGAPDATTFAGLFDPAPMPGAVPLAPPAPATVQTAFAVPAPAPASAPPPSVLPAAPAPIVAAEAPVPQRVPSAPLPPQPGAQPSQAASGRPAVAERPAGMQPPVREASRPRHQSRTAVAAAPAPDTRGFLERVFGIGGSQQTAALGYAAPQDEAADSPRSRRLGLGSTAGDQTAIYDISARTVFLPNGEKLEAHSGLGEHKDDPRSAHIRMRGVTPPHVYDLTMREAPFHGVRALRLNPVGGNGAIHGRDGLLAHTYLLGPNGDSNGCVSFRDYDRFLKAYLRGEVRRLVVVASMN